jgi:4-amino-4-deoxy-L-arabinose transferase-like glycosyltransferase
LTEKLIQSSGESSHRHLSDGGLIERLGDRRSFALLAIALVAFGIYANTLSNGFVYDDAKQILANRWITDPRYLGDILTHDVWGFWPERAASSYYRPLMHVVYMMEYQVSGLSPWAYHLMNVLIHTGTSLLVFFVALQLLRRSGDTSSSRSAGIAFLAALCFAAHPIHSEAV